MRTPRTLIAATAAVSLVLAACGSDVEPAPLEDDDDAAAEETDTEADAADDEDAPDVAEDAAVQLRFQSLAWQEESIEANHRIVEAWNEQNPDVQVQYVQGDWGSAHDQLLTSFEGGDPPDVFHYEAAASQIFAEGGFLADLDELLSDEFKDSIDEQTWGTVDYDEHGLIGVPFLFESRLALANATKLEEAGIEVPAPDDPWTWDEFREVLMELTDDDTYGIAWPLASPASQFHSLGQGFGASYIDDVDGDPQISITETEVEVPRRIHQMIYEDGSVAPGSISSSSTDALPGFLEGDYAMIFGAIWLRQQLSQQAPEDFDWVVIPPLEGPEGIRQAANPQTISIAVQSDHPEEAAEFVEFFLSAENLAQLALGDWLVPTSEGALAQVESETGGELGWDVAVASVGALASADWQRVSGFAEWTDRFATPAYQEYVADEITLEELQAELQDHNVRFGD